MKQVGGSPSEESKLLVVKSEKPIRAGKGDIVGECKGRGMQLYILKDLVLPTLATVRLAN